MLQEKDILSLLSTDCEETLFQRANMQTEKVFGKKVYLRGLLEFSNVCEKNCYYCGLRNENRLVSRYQMKAEEIVSVALWAHQNQYKTLLLQSGEFPTETQVASLAELIQEICKKTHNDLTIALSLGELSFDAYRRLFRAGASRYLLRIETSNPLLYKKIHPENCSFDHRLQCLKDLQSIGYQLGTGVMIGLPGQTLEDLARDILFFQKIEADMIGMGPFLPHSQTPLGIYPEENNLLSLALRMIAATRLSLPDLLITATTAMQALHPEGREKALLAGANVWMPSLTPLQYRQNYLLYEKKPCQTETKEKCHECVSFRIRKIGKIPAWGERGDPPHFFKGRNKCS